MSVNSILVLADQYSQFVKEAKNGKVPKLFLKIEGGDLRLEKPNWLKRWFYIPFRSKYRFLECAKTAKELFQEARENPAIVDDTNREKLQSFALWYEKRARRYFDTQSGFFHNVLRRLWGGPVELNKLENISLLPKEQPENLEVKIKDLFTQRVQPKAKQKRPQTRTGRQRGVRGAPRAKERMPTEDTTEERDATAREAQRIDQVYQQALQASQKKSSSTLRGQKISVHAQGGTPRAFIRETFREGGFKSVFRRAEFERIGEIWRCVREGVYAKPLSSDKLGDLKKDLEIAALLQKKCVHHTVGMRKVTRLSAGAKDPTKGIFMHEYRQSLSEYLNTSRRSAREKMQIALDIAEALSGTHENQGRAMPSIVLLDLKPDNVLLDGDNRAFITDFGLSEVVKGGFQDICPGSPAWMAPEQIVARCMHKSKHDLANPLKCMINQNGDMEIDTRVDMWAFGRILLQLVHGKKAPGCGVISEVLGGLKTEEEGKLPGSVVNEELQKIVPALNTFTGNLKAFLDSHPHRANGLITRLLSIEIEDRPSAAETEQTLRRIFGDM